MMTSRIDFMAHACYAAECEYLGKVAECWDTHEQDNIEYWKKIIRLGQQAYWDELRAIDEVQAAERKTNRFITLDDALMPAGDGDGER